MGRHGQKSITPRRWIEDANAGGFDVHPEKNTLLCPPMGAFRQASLSLENTTGFDHVAGTNQASN
jgi:hypothetical protein